MTKYDLLASVKTQVLVINEDSVRLNTGPSAPAPPHLTASELWPSFQTAPPLECPEMKARLLFKVLSLRRITSRQFSMSLCSLCLVRVSQIYKTTLWRTRCLQTHSRRNISWSLLFSASGPMERNEVCLPDCPPSIMNTLLPIKGCCEASLCCHAQQPETLSHSRISRWCVRVSQRLESSMRDGLFLHSTAPQHSSLCYCCHDIRWSHAWFLHGFDFVLWWWLLRSIIA